MKSNNKKFKVVFSFILIATLIAVVSSILRYPSDIDSINFENSDATYHTLLTMQAYDETDLSIHRFLPIVTLGNESDKNISWGGTIPDKYGNYYYTSFSPAGYVLPYLFCKVFSLPISFESLYIFNSILYFISIVLIEILIYLLFNKSKYRMHVTITSAFVYSLIPEVLFAMGIVYWHQSIMQIFLILQLIVFYLSRHSNKIIFYILFCVLCVINPYIEWTGYVANVGYAIAFILMYRKNLLKGFLWSIVIGILTFCSFIIFSLHYLSVIDKNEYIQALNDRFMSRSVFREPSFTGLINGYITSFASSFLIIALLIIILIITYKGFSFVKNSIILQNKVICFVALFSVLENIILKEHAAYYTYDRMKLAIFITILIADLLQMLFMMIKPIKIFKLSFLLSIIAVLFISIFSYSYLKRMKVWTISYGYDNKLLANYITEKYEPKDSVYGLDTLQVRGYLNLLFHSSIYEQMSIESLSKISNNKSCRYAVEIFVENDYWSLFKLNYIYIYDSHLNEYTKVFIDNGEIMEVKTSIKEINP